MAAPEIDLYTGDLPLRSQPLTFSVNQENYLTWEVPMIGQMNTSVSFVNDKAVEVEDNLLLTNNDVVTSAENAAESLQYSQDSAASANYVGTWIGQTGSAIAGISVGHDGAFWRLNVALADITASEPTPNNSDWSFSSGTRWVQPSVIPANSQSFVTTIAATDRQLPTMVANDFLYVKSSASSSDDLRLLNGIYSIVSTTKTLISTDNLVLKPGEAISLMCVNSTTLEVVK